MLAGQGDDFAHQHIGRHHQRILDHAAFEAFNLGDLGGLGTNRQILVHDADAAFLRQGDGKTRLGDRVHRRRQQGQIDANGSGELGRERNVAWMNLGVGGNEEDVVERQGLFDEFHVQGSGKKRIIRESLRLAKRPRRQVHQSRLAISPG